MKMAITVNEELHVLMEISNLIFCLMSLGQKMSFNVGPGQNNSHEAETVL